MILLFIWGWFCLCLIILQMTRNYNIILEEQTESLMKKSRREELLHQEQLQKDSELGSSTDGHTQLKARSTLLDNDLEKQEEEKRRKKAKDPKKTFSRLFKYAWKSKHLMIVANIALLISSGTMVLLPSLCGSMVDTIRLNGDLLQGAIKFIILTVFMAIFSSIRGYTFNMLGEIIMVQMRLQLFDKIITKDIAYYDKTKSGELLSRLGSDVATIKSVCSDNLSMIVRNILQFFGSLIFLWLISWKLTLVIIIVTPIVSFSLLFIFKYIKKYEKEYSNNLAKVSALVTEVFGNIRVVRSFSNEDLQNKNYQVLLQKVYDTGKKKAFMYAVMLIIMTTFSNLLILVILFFGGQLVIDSQMSIGDLTSYVLYTITLTIGFASISGIVNQSFSALGICQNIFEIIDEPVKVVTGVAKLNFNQINNAVPIIQFQNACFSYPSKESVQILKGINLKIFHGQSVAIVGPSGSGKSSIISLILRFYDVNSGAININGNNIKDIDIKELREHIGFVSQEPTLFSGSLLQNIQYGLRTDENKDQIIAESLQNANAKQFVYNQQLFPQKLQTLVGERGVKLSGGQKQRIAIARCLAKQPKIMIFDQATSALDAQSQYQVQHAIDALLNKHDRTMVIVAHRLSTIINCDRILVIQKGLIVQQGNHKELLLKKGIYAHLVERQLSSHVQ